MDQLDLPGTAKPKRKPGRPRVWASEAERRADQNTKRRERRAERKARAADAETESRRDAGIAARLASLAPAPAPLDVRDVDLVELAQDFPNTAEGLQYARDVLSGRIVACNWVRLACERHERDLERIVADDWPFTFSAARAERVLRACQMFREIRGPRAGKRFRFATWQKFVVGSAFGWIEKATGFRRYRYLFLAVPRGNGKSSLAATIGLYMLALDGEGGAEVYAAAVTRDQARIVFNLAQHMTRADTAFCAKYGVSIAAHSVVQESTASFFRPLSRDAQALDGLNVHLAICDELAAHKTREIHDVLVTATGKRSSPLILSITTAGANQAGVGFEQWKYTQRVLSGEVTDERFFGILYTIDEGDAWDAPESWAKANPNWGTSVNPDVVANLAGRARQIASQQGAFKQKHLNVWTNAAVAWMNPAAWAACADESLDENDFKGEACVIGLDLAAKIDLAAAVKVFARDIEGVTHYYVFPRFYLPAAAIHDGRNASYQTWNADGWIIDTPGEVIDFDRIEDDIKGDAVLHSIADVAYDPWQALKLAADLTALDIPAIEYRPTVANFSPAMKEVDALVRQGRLHHNGNPVLAWCVSCVEVAEDYKGNIFPRKDRHDPTKKIDGLVALLMAMGRRMATELAQETEPTLTFV